MRQPRNGTRLHGHRPYERADLLLHRERREQRRARCAEQHGQRYTDWTDLSERPAEPAGLTRHQPELPWLASASIERRRSDHQLPSVPRNDEFEPNARDKRRMRQPRNGTRLHGHRPYERADLLLHRERREQRRARCAEQHGQRYTDWTDLSERPAEPAGLTRHQPELPWLASASIERRRSDHQLPSVPRNDEFEPNARDKRRMRQPRNGTRLHGHRPYERADLLLHRERREQRRARCAEQHGQRYTDWTDLSERPAEPAGLTRHQPELPWLASASIERRRSDHQLPSVPRNDEFEPNARDKRRMRQPRNGTRLHGHRPYERADLLLHRECGEQRRAGPRQQYGQRYTDRTHISRRSAEPASVARYGAKLPRLASASIERRRGDHQLPSVSRNDEFEPNARDKRRMRQPRNGTRLHGHRPYERADLLLHRECGEQRRAGPRQQYGQRYTDWTDLSERPAEPAGLTRHQPE